MPKLLLSPRSASTAEGSSAPPSLSTGSIKYAAAKRGPRSAARCSAASLPPRLWVQECTKKCKKCVSVCVCVSVGGKCASSCLRLTIHHLSVPIANGRQANGSEVSAAPVSGCSEACQVEPAVPAAARVGRQLSELGHYVRQVASLCADCGCVLICVGLTCLRSSPVLQAASEGSRTGRGEAVTMQASV